MQRIENIEDRMNGLVTYDLGNGKRLQVLIRDIAEYGLAAILKDHGYAHLLRGERVPVIQRGKRIGTLPSDFDPAYIKSTSFLYDPRPGDFRRGEDGWVAAPQLGPGDFECVPGFVWNSEQ